MTTPKLTDIVFESGEYWVLRVSTGFEVYRAGATSSTRCARIGYIGERGIERAKAEIDRRQFDDLRLAARVEQSHVRNSFTS
jgi:hypothetical protein